MPMHKNFDSNRGAIPTEGPTFDLWGETFHCVPLPPGGVLARLTGTGVNVATFVEDCLLEFNVIHSDGTDGNDVLEPTDDVKRWRALMADKERPVRPEKLVEIVLWLSEEYGERPTVRSRP